jgi:hypothetical protein
VILALRRLKQFEASLGYKVSPHFKKTTKSWLTPVILATEEAEIRRMVVRSQPRQIVP